MYSGDESNDTKTRGALPSAPVCSYVCSRKLVHVLEPFVLKGVNCSHAR